MALPMPRPAPVTIATLPESFAGMPSSNPNQSTSTGVKLFTTAH
jgi:hypothetical protein